MIATPPRHLFTVDDFHRMIEAGVLHQKDRVELVDGEVVEMAAVGPWHATYVRDLSRLLTLRVGDKAIVDAQNPLVITDTKELYPDVFVNGKRIQGYRKVGTPISKRAKRPSIGRPSHSSSIRKYR